MIQRLQSLLLLAAAIINFTLVFLPVWFSYNENGATGQSITAELYGSQIELRTDDGSGQWQSTQVSFTDDGLLFGAFALVVLNSLFFLATIFMYKDRPRQLKLVNYGLLALLLEIAILAALVMQLDSLVGEPHAGSPMDRFESSFKFGLFAPPVALIFAWWATFRIRKDEKKVRAMDRLR